MNVPPNSKPREVAFWEGRPIEKFADDQLGRKEFARFFAEAITHHSGNESLVLGVNAPWGEGKTSFKNMMTDLLTQEKADRVITLNFTPWEWASQNQVSEAFFTEISKQLELKDKSEDAKRAAERFRQLGKYLGLTSKLAMPAGMLLEPVLPGSTIVTFAIGKGLKKAYEISRDAAHDMQREAEHAKKSLPDVKNELRMALKSFLDKERKLILVVVDDIDRLSPEEIRLVFQMVRVNADFPAMVFLLLYDESFVLKALNTLFGQDSSKFLEKIVQFQTSLPVLTENRLRDHMTEKITEFLKNHPPYAALFDKTEFHKLWKIGIKDYVTNLRQCGRLLSSYEFHLGVFRSYEAEVNPMDFLIIEIFRLFDKKLHENIYTKSEKLFPSFLDFHIFDEPKEGGKSVFDERVEEVLSGAKLPAAVKLFGALFPKHGRGNEPFGITDEDQMAARQRRLCHILYFNRYFRLTVDAGDIPEERITELAAAMNEPAKFIAFLTELAKESVLPLALTKLLARDNLKPAHDEKEMIGRLCDFGEIAAVVPKSGVLVEPLDGLRTLVMLHIDPTLKSGHRLAIIEAGIQKSKGIHLPVLLARIEDINECQYSRTDIDMKKEYAIHLDRADADKLSVIVAARVEQAIQANVLKPTAEWEQSFQWYLSTMNKSIAQSSEIILDHPMALALTLLVIISKQAVKQYRETMRSPHFAESPIIFTNALFGLETFDKALSEHEIELRKMDGEISRRIEIYRDMRTHFSHLAEPKTLKAGNG